MSDELLLEELDVKQLLQLQVRLLASIQAQLIELNAAATPEESEECEHPQEDRISLASLTEPDRWYCKACKKDSKEDLMN